MDAIIDYINKSMDALGFYGPQMLFISTIFLLLHKKTYLTIYLIGFGINIILNTILKEIIKQPRPKEDKRLFHLQVLFGKHIGYDRYGMPSGHSQTSFFSTLFVYLVLKDKRIAFIYLLSSFITMYQRVNSYSHTVQQVCIGAIIGSLIAFIMFRYGKNILKGNPLMKLDDMAPI